MGLRTGLGRLLFVTIFLYKALTRLQLWDEHIQAVQTTWNRHPIRFMSETLNGLILSFTAAVLVIVTVVETSGAVVFALGAYRLGSSLLLLYMLITIPVTHWPVFLDGSVDHGRVLEILMYLSITGALLMVNGLRPSSSAQEAALENKKKQQ